MVKEFKIITTNGPAIKLVGVGLSMEAVSRDVESG
jgi:hypothetical protein